MTRLAAAAAALAAVALLASCSTAVVEGQASPEDQAQSAAASTTASSEQDRNLGGRGPITFAMGVNDADVLRPIIAEWNSTHPDEMVTLTELPAGADDALDQLTQSLRAGRGDYDVMALDVVWTAEFADAGWLQPLAGEFAMDTSGLFPAVVDSATFRGAQYAAPMNTNTQLLYYRTDIVPDGPEDWQDLVNSCSLAAVHEIDCLVTQLKNYEGLTVNATQFIHSWGGSVSSQANAGLQALVDAYQSGAIAKRSTGFDESATSLAFTGGEAMYAYNWPYMAAMAEDPSSSKVAGKVGLAPIRGPAGAGASTLGGYNNAINVYSANKATAFDFATFLQGESAQRSLGASGYPPVLAKMYDDAGILAAYPYFPVLKAALEQAKPRPIAPHYFEVSRAIADNTAAALAGGKSVDAAAADIASAVESLGD